jgi:hypothetical protein
VPGRRRWRRPLPALAWQGPAGGAVALVGTLLLAACAAGPNNVAEVDAPHIAGFWLGVWHGLICPVAFVISLFSDSVSIYDVHNNGGWYDFGFVLGACVSFGGSSRAPAAGRRAARDR